MKNGNHAETAVEMLPTAEDARIMHTLRRELDELEAAIAKCARLDEEAERTRCGYDATMATLDLNSRVRRLLPHLVAAGRARVTLTAERDAAHCAMFTAVADLAKATERLRTIEAAARLHYDAADDCVCPVCTLIVSDLVTAMDLAEGEGTRTRKATT